MKYLFVAKGNNIFTSNDNILRFYGLISGSVSINHIKLITLENKGKI